MSVIVFPLPLLPQPEAIKDNLGFLDYNDGNNSLKTSREGGKKGDAERFFHIASFILICPRHEGATLSLSYPLLLLPSSPLTFSFPRDTSVIVLLGG